MVSKLSEALALKRGYPPVVARQIGVAARLHDIGKMQIPKEILNKPGELSADEFEVVKTHTILGADMLSSIQGEIGKMAVEVCRLHHEWYDGSGSYWGNKASELPEYISIVSLADVFMACLSERPYKAAQSLETALEYIKQQAGTQFCPKLAGDFISLVNSGGVSAILEGTVTNEHITGN